MYQRAQFFDFKRRLAPVKHCMTVRTDGNKIIDRINAIFVSDRSNRYSVVHVNKSGAEFPVFFSEVEIAHLACGSMVCNAGVTCFDRTLVTIHKNLLRRAFHLADVLRKFIRVKRSGYVCCRWRQYDQIRRGAHRLQWFVSEALTDLARATPFVFMEAQNQINGHGR